MSDGGPTVSQARSWDVSPLLRQATEWEEAHANLAKHVDTAAHQVEDSKDFWRGEAAEAIRGRHGHIVSAAGAIRDALAEAADAARQGYHAIGDADTLALRAINYAESQGYEVGEDGAVTMSPAQTATAMANPARAQATLAILRHGAAAHTVIVQTALAGLGAADIHTAAAINSAFTTTREMNIAAPMKQVPWWEWLADIATVILTLPLDETGVGEELDAAEIAAMRQAGKKAAEEAAKSGATKGDAEQAGKEAMKKYAVDNAPNVPSGLRDMFKNGNIPKASQLEKWAEDNRWKMQQTPNGPPKFLDRNGVVRMTLKKGSPRAPGSEDSHIELRNAKGERVGSSGNQVTRKSPDNHTRIDWDLK